jgi:hypothetical protein
MTDLQISKDFQHRVVAEQRTIVVFRRWRKPISEAQSIIALFPEVEHRWPYCSSYEHVGQHGAADYTGVIDVTRPCYMFPGAPWEAEVRALHAELTQLGYKLDVRQRYVKKRSKDNV